LAHANQTHSLHSLAHLAQLNQTRATALYSLAMAGLSMARRPGYGEPRNQTRPLCVAKWLQVRGGYSVAASYLHCLWHLESVSLLSMLGTVAELMAKLFKFVIAVFIC
jgi:hypothetical protein